MSRTASLLAAGLLLAARALHGADFSIDWNGESLTVCGARSSAAHEEIIGELASSAFPGANRRLKLVASGALPPGWALFTEELLRAVAATAAADVRVRDSRVRLRGSAPDAGEWNRARGVLERALLPGMRLDDEVLTALPGERQLREQCRGRFAALFASGSVRFRHGDTALSPASRPLLDALAELASECASARLDVTGHTDASGAEELNLALSRARAEAVVAYLVARGLEAGRLTAFGKGASEPLDASGTPSARARNRRIELEARFDDAAY